MPEPKAPAVARRLHVAAALATLTLGLSWVNGDPRYTGRTMAPLFVVGGVVALVVAARRAGRAGDTGPFALAAAALLAYPVARYIRFLDLRVLVLLAVAVILALSAWRGTRLVLDKVADAIT